jgi:hypothetical protein
LACIPKVRYHGGKFCSCCAAQCIGKEDHFHQIIIRRRASGLNDEYVSTADIILNFHHGFAIAEAANLCFADGQIEMVRNLLG